MDIGEISWILLTISRIGWAERVFQQQTRQHQEICLTCFKMCVILPHGIGKTNMCVRWVSQNHVYTCSWCVVPFGICTHVFHQWPSLTIIIITITIISKVIKWFPSDYILYIIYIYIYPTLKKEQIKIIVSKSSANRHCIPIYYLGKFSSAIWGWFPLVTMIPVRSRWGPYNLPRYAVKTAAFGEA